LPGHTFTSRKKRKITPVKKESHNNKITVHLIPRLKRFKMEKTFTTEVTETNEVLTSIYERRAVRKYKPKGVSIEHVIKIIDAGRMAPSAMNRQPWKFYVLTKKEDIETLSAEMRRSLADTTPKFGTKRIAADAVSGKSNTSVGLSFLEEEDPVFHGAPVVIFLTAPRNMDGAGLEIGMCAQNMMLAARSLGLDTCPVGFGKLVAETQSYSKLKIGHDEEVLLAITVGHGNEKAGLHTRIKSNAIYL
jgi:nitroreductase